MRVEQSKREQMFDDSLQAFCWLSSVWLALLALPLPAHSQPHVFVDGEDHSIPGKPTYHSFGGDGFADIPLDCLRAKGLDNVFYAGRLIGADDMAYGSIRVMGTAFATGEAAGRAASNFL